MTDNEIMKALECCIEVDACHRCPYGAACLDDKYKSIIAKDALDLINRKGAEIERLQTELVATRYSENAFKEENRRLVKLRKVDAIKEFAERLKKKVVEYHCAEVVFVESIDNLLKEMEGEDGLY